MFRIALVLEVPARRPVRIGEAYFMAEPGKEGKVRLVISAPRSINVSRCKWDDQSPHAKELEAYLWRDANDTGDPPSSNAPQTASR